MTEALLNWNEDGEPRSARWHSGSGAPCPKRVRVVDDTLKADTAYKLACEGHALLWRGDYHQARQMLQALAHRIDLQRARRPQPPAESAKAGFHQHRKAQAERARILGQLVFEFGVDHSLPLRRAPDAQLAARAAIGDQTQPYVASLRELLGWIGAWEWRQKGVPTPQLGLRKNGETVHIHPYYGVFSPVRGEYLDLLEDAPLPAALKDEGAWAFDIGTGTGVIAALLARRGVARIEATDTSATALACALDNLQRLGLQHRVKLSSTDLFPAGRAALIVCNPPWLPAKPSSALEAAVYDPDSRMLRGFLAGLAAHLLPGGEGWLILSDLAEHLGLRDRADLLGWIDQAGLRVIDLQETRPRHPKAQDGRDPLHAARREELTGLWRLGVK
ncbi:SAM-dependent methyltransferase [Inhella inkyongensis]|uniref:SAM-dependent methyltransferase n=1 Tax=Inhella inkyongensis TaxID=392593 RepID=A0A840S2N1_9BURK|nr:class I SAM-dependent methyltransferase [Inhella inkyongensis]MBB5204575.1 SAM-dependent methyltransferase [Inhella inkyongensis]